jgi:hypothetical protein
LAAADSSDVNDSASGAAANTQVMSGFYPHDKNTMDTKMRDDTVANSDSDDEEEEATEGTNNKNPSTLG